MTSARTGAAMSTVARNIHNIFVSITSILPVKFLRENFFRSGSRFAPLAASDFKPRDSQVDSNLDTRPNQAPSASKSLAARTSLLQQTRRTLYRKQRAVTTSL